MLRQRERDGVKFMVVTGAVEESIWNETKRLGIRPKDIVIRGCAVCIEEAKKIRGES